MAACSTLCAPNIRVSPLGLREYRGDVNLHEVFELEIADAELDHAMGLARQLP